MERESQKIILVEERPPTRCEICHQSDLFDPQKNLCFRCKDICMSKITDESFRKMELEQLKLLFLGSNFFEATSALSSLMFCGIEICLIVYRGMISIAGMFFLFLFLSMFIVSRRVRRWAEKEIDKN